MLAVDISFEGSGHGGVASSKYVRDLLHNRYPETIPLVLVIKELLAQRHLNEPFTGGVSSYAVVLMVVAVFQMWYYERDGKGGSKDKARAFAAWRAAVVDTNNGASANNNPTHNADMPSLPIGKKERINMGEMLTKFFSFFGREFDIRQYGLCIDKDPPGLFLLPHVLEGNDTTPAMLSTIPYIEDPTSNPSRNVAHSAFRYETAIQGLFSNKLTELEIQGVGMLDQHHRNVASRSPPSPNNGRRQFAGGKVNVLKNIVMNY
jgi:DNA polymerase sigma